jgi:murein DD-endopeptidase MepM/ murein hydrolase activator NlpD
MKALVFFFFILMISSCGVQYRLPKNGGSSTDTSHIYALPYPAGVAHFMIQGYNSFFSHKGRLNLDFKMKKGSPIAAARKGIVVRVVERFKRGGVHIKFLSQANQVIVQHDDGTQAMYGHLQYNGALVSVGDTVQVGQVIAKAGSTGYSAISHLHFYVWRFGSAGREVIPTRFYTGKGIKYLRPGRWYRARKRI